MRSRFLVALLLALAIVACSAVAAWAPKRYTPPSKGHRVTVVSMRQPPIRGGG